MLRIRLLASGVGMAFLTVLALGVLMLVFESRTAMREVRTRASLFVEAVGAQCTADLVERRLETGSVRFVEVLDSRRHVVAHTLQGLYGRIASDPFEVEAAASDEALVRTVESGDDEYLVASVPVVSAVPGEPGIRWGTVVAGFGLEQVRQSLDRLVRITLLTIVALLLATVIPTVWLLHRQFVRPVQALTDAVRRFAGGDLGARSCVRSRDELALLSTGFNEMADRIERQTRSLEEEIRLRTFEIQETNRRLSEANARLQDLATTDGLTGLFNFRHFSATLASEVQRCARVHMPVSMLMIDVDHFKQFNDAHGHQAGDEVLRDLASHVRSRVRKTDVPCRYGGEEFAVILVDTERDEALAVAEDLRALIETARFHSPDGLDSFGITISIGVATFPDDAPDPDTLIRASDDAMYRAKQAGRNRVERAQPIPRA